MDRVIFCTEFVLLTVLLVWVKATTITVNKDHCGGNKNLDENESVFLNYYGAHFKKCDSANYLSAEKKCTFKISASRSNNEICIKKKSLDSFYKLEKCSGVFKYYIGSNGPFSETSYSCIDFDADPLCTTRDTVYAVFVLHNTSFVSCEHVSVELEIYARKPPPKREKQRATRRSRTPRLHSDISDYTDYSDTYDWTYDSDIIDDTDVTSLSDLADYYDFSDPDYFDILDYDWTAWSHPDTSYDTSDTSYDTSDTSYDTDWTSWTNLDDALDYKDWSWTNTDSSDDSDWESWSNSDTSDYSDYTSWSDSDTSDYLDKKISTGLPIIFGILGVSGGFVLLVLIWICCIKDHGSQPSLPRSVQDVGPVVPPNDPVNNEPRNGHPSRNEDHNTHEGASEDTPCDPWKPPDYDSVILVDQTFYGKLDIHWTPCASLNNQNLQSQTMKVSV